MSTRRAPVLVSSRGISYGEYFLSTLLMSTFTRVDNNSEWLFYIFEIFFINILICYYFIISFDFLRENKDKTWTDAYSIIQHKDSANERVRPLRPSAWTSADYHYPIFYAECESGGRVRVRQNIVEIMPRKTANNSETKSKKSRNILFWACFRSILWPWNECVLVS